MRRPEAIAPERPASPPPACLKIVRIEVRKRDRTLEAECKRGAVITMKVALGREEIGPKRRAGDHRTPEGRYRIAGNARPSRYRLFLPIDYPSRDDAHEGLADGRLTRRGYERIVAAHENGELPPDDTGLGGNLGFHGEGERWRGDSRYHDWTYGCVAVTDDEIQFLAERVEAGVPVWIRP